MFDTSAGSGRPRAQFLRQARAALRALDQPLTDTNG